MKTVFNLISLCYGKLPYFLRTKGIAISFLILVSTVVDLLGVATVFPVFSLFLSDDALANTTLKAIYDWSGATSEQHFFYMLIGVVSVVLFLKVCFQIVSNFIQGKYIYQVYSYYVKQMYLSAFKDKFSVSWSENSDDVKSDIYILPRVFANQLMNSLLSFIAEIFILILIFTALLIYNWKVVATLALTIIPMLIIFYLSVRRKTETVDVELKSYIAKIARSVSVALFGNTDIRLSRSFISFFSKFDKIIFKESKLLNWKLTLTKLPALIVELIILFAFIIMVFINIYQGNSRDALLLQISVFGVASLKLMPSVNRLLYAIMNIKANMYSAVIVETEAVDSNMLAATEPLGLSNSIRIQHAVFGYPGKQNIFDDLSVSISAGDRIGIVGESGAGKTTFLKLLLGQVELAYGSFTVDGNKIDSQNRNPWLATLGMVNQEVFILDDTVKANIAFGADTIDHERLNYVVKLASLEAFVESLPDGLNTNLGEMGSLISGGQRQRIGIARALYHDAKLLLFDEATSALDNKTEQYVIESIEKLPPTITIIAITHRLSFLKFCNKIYRLEKGKLQEVVDKDQIFSPN